MNYLHGVTLQVVVEHLRAEYGWQELARRVPVGCFQNSPSLSSSLKFLRKTAWAREQVEREYIKLMQHEDANPLIHDLKCGKEVNTAALSQSKIHEALGWMLRHMQQSKLNIDTYFLPVLSAVGDVNFWSDSETMPLINLAIEHSGLGKDNYELRFLQALIERGAYINDKRYWPPIMHTTDIEGQAYKSGTRAPRMDILDLLIRRGADPTIKDKRGLDALGIAEAYELRAAINKLKH